MGCNTCGKNKNIVPAKPKVVSGTTKIVLLK
jgi:hypothetical protein